MASCSGDSRSGSVDVKILKRKNAPGNRSDVGWEHGYEVEGGDSRTRKVRCKYCDKEISGGIYRFKHHLAGTRKDTGACLKVPKNVKKDMLDVLVKSSERTEEKKKGFGTRDEESDGDDEEVLRRKNMVTKRRSINSLFRRCKSTQHTITQMFKKDSREEEEEVSREIARFFYTSGIPLSCVKNPVFEKMCELIGKCGPSFIPPSYHEIGEKYLKKEIKHTMELLEKHKAQWKKTGCSILCDGWTNKRQRSIRNFLVNSNEGTIFLSSVDASGILESAEKVFEMLDEAVDKVGEENVVQVITENTTNYKLAGGMLMEKRKSLWWTPCAAHCIELMLEDFGKNFKVHHETIRKGKKITAFIYSRTLLIDMLKQFTEGRDLIRPGVTQFATAYLTLGCLNELKGELMAMFSSQTWKNSEYAGLKDAKDVENVVFNCRFWQNITICIKAAYPLLDVRRLVDLEEKPAMGFIYEEMNRCKEKIQNNFNNVKESYETIWEIIDARWESQLLKPLHVTVYFLNPQFHHGPNLKAGFEVKKGLYDCLSRMVPDLKESCKIDLQIDEFKAADGLFGSEFAQRAWDTETPVDWWKSYGNGCPELQRFAIRILSLSCGSSGLKHNWRIFDTVHAKRRNNLRQKRMNNLVFVMYNLKLEDKQARNQLELDDLSSDDEWITASQADGGS
ncbi:hypothetical protein SLEP1_g44844 [Rubroshorea leprosula]|uniref:BED-type domain-containing protein n=1 Tax=Rubroshorea leprosula TaxID=152421 RepID=A0AAV5LJL8_9ROSI|nr:hypothetical protein SLEP1_g44844 [Rubroshorea leprosula]